MSEKYCVLPGQTPVRLTTTDGGHTCIIGETPREIPSTFELDALAKGCVTQTMMEALAIRLQASPAGADETEAQRLEAERLEAERLAAESNDVNRANQIKAASIEIINAGNPADLTNGKPKVEVLTAKLGYDVTGAERDVAFTAITA